jgi:hypothetical protein
MKTFKILLPLILLIGFTLATTAALEVPKPKTTTIESICVKAVYSGGTYIPVVDLPEIEIVGFHSSTVLHAEISNGKILPTVNLPVVEISGKRVMNQNIQSTSENSETIHDIPVIEVIAQLPLKKLVHTTVTGDNYMATINLPEIIISVSKDLTAEISYKYSPFFTNNQSQNNFTNTTISPELINALVNLYPADYATKFYSISTAECLITENRQKVCELVVKLGDNAVEQLRTTVIKIITN